jgi:hypothetical protein
VFTRDIVVYVGLLQTCVCDQTPETMLAKGAFARVHSQNAPFAIGKSTSQDLQPSHPACTRLTEEKHPHKLRKTFSTQLGRALQHSKPSPQDMENLLTRQKVTCIEGLTHRRCQRASQKPTREDSSSP